MGTLNLAPPPPTGSLILAINSGSSSLKIGFFRRSGTEEEAVLSGVAEGIARQDGSLRLADPQGRTLAELPHVLESQQEALAKLLELSREYLQQAPTIVGHRIVHGGPKLTRHQLVTEEVMTKLEQAIHFAPLHIPSALALLRHSQSLFPGIPQVACFDTAFHCSLPQVARRLPLPSQYDEIGLRRYGFHGLSYESIVHRLRDRLPGRTIVAHLGNGSSLCALSWGHSIETTMGLTPTGGIPMATRTGNLDPGVLLFLMRSQGMTPDALENLVNRQSGLKALGGDSDMKTLLARRVAGDHAAADAIAYYVHGIRLALGAYAVALGGLDLLIFTGGIGEHSSEIRSMVCRGLDIIHLTDDPGCNRVMVIPSEEEQQIARICSALLAS